MYCKKARKIPRDTAILFRRDGPAGERTKGFPGFRRRPLRPTALGNTAGVLPNPVGTAVGVPRSLRSAAVPAPPASPVPALPGQGLSPPPAVKKSPGMNRGEQCPPAPSGIGPYRGRSYHRSMCGFDCVQAGFSLPQREGDDRRPQAGGFRGKEALAGGEDLPAGGCLSIGSGPPSGVRGSKAGWKTERTLRPAFQSGKAGHIAGTADRRRRQGRKIGAAIFHQPGNRADGRAAGTGREGRSSATEKGNAKGPRPAYRRTGPFPHAVTRCKPL